jgi:hypothetical protein
MKNKDLLMQLQCHAFELKWHRAEDAQFDAQHDPIYVDMFITACEANPPLLLLLHDHYIRFGDSIKDPDSSYGRLIGLYLQIQAREGPNFKICPECDMPNIVRDETPECWGCGTCV